MKRGGENAADCVAPCFHCAVDCWRCLGDGGHIIDTDNARRTGSISISMVISSMAMLLVVCFFTTAISISIIVTMITRG